jgi:hypothetical protein
MVPLGAVLGQVSGCEVRVGHYLSAGRTEGRAGDVVLHADTVGRHYFEAGHFIALEYGYVGWNTWRVAIGGG